MIGKSKEANNYFDTTKSSNKRRKINNAEIENIFLRPGIFIVPGIRER